MRAPVQPMRTNEAGGRWGIVRPSTGQHHWGYDLHAPAGTPVVAPESGVVVVSRPVADSDPPFSRYGPAVVLLRGDSGRYHLLAHLRANALAFDVRTDQAARAAGADVARTLASAAGVRVAEGAQLGEVSGMWDYGARGWWGEAHWEVRPTVLASGDRTLDPVRWLADRGTSPPAPAVGGSTWPLVLVSILLLALGSTRS